MLRGGCQNDTESGNISETQLRQQGAELSQLQVRKPRQRKQKSLVDDVFSMSKVSISDPGLPAAIPEASLPGQ